MSRGLAVLCAVGVCLFALPGPAAGQQVILTNAVVDLGASPPTVTLTDLLDAFGTPGQVWQVVDGAPVALVVVSWTAGSIVAELASTAPGDYLVSVLPAGVPALQRAVFTVTVPGDNPDYPCFDNFNRYVDCGNGTVSDTMTGLIWLADADCFGQRTYADANALAAGLADGQCGLTDGSRPGDWRLPSRSEWGRTIWLAVYYGCSPSLVNDPGMDCLAVGPTSFFNLQSARYWSSSSDPELPINARSVLLLDGNLLGMSKSGSSLHVWPVRGHGQGDTDGRLGN